MTTETTHTIDEIAEQFDRLCPSQVDHTECDHGYGRESGHVAHEPATIGWYCEAGNVGHRVATVPAECVDPLHARLASLSDGSLDRGGLEQIVVECGGEWHC